MKNMADIMRQAQEMQAKIAEAQEKAENVVADGVAGAGLVKMTLKGKGEMVSLEIDHSLMGEDPEMLDRFRGSNERSHSRPRRHDAGL